jgi:transposase
LRHNRAGNPPRKRLETVQTYRATSYDEPEILPYQIRLVGPIGADVRREDRQGDQAGATRKQYFAEEKIRIVLDGLRGEDSIAELCRREGIAQGVYYKWSKDFMEAGKRRLAGDIARAATTDEVKDLRREARDLKEVVAEQTLELRLLKKAR